MSVSIEPLRDMLTVKPLPAPAYQGRLIALATQESAVRGEVIGIGPEVRDVEIGAQIVFSRLQGFEVNLGQPVILIPEGAVLATF